VYCERSENPLTTSWAPQLNRERKAKESKKKNMILKPIPPKLNQLGSNPTLEHIAHNFHH